METSESLLTSGVAPPVCVMLWRRVGQDESETMDSRHSVFISSYVPFPPPSQGAFIRAWPYGKLPTSCNPKVINVLTDEPSRGSGLKTQRSQTAEVKMFVRRVLSGLLNTAGLRYKREHTLHWAQQIRADLWRRCSVIPDMENKTNEEVSRHGALSCLQTLQ